MQIKEGQTVIDSTLAIAGAAADAKMTGDKIKAIKSDIAGQVGDINSIPITLATATAGIYITGNISETAQTASNSGYCYTSFSAEENANYIVNVRQGTSVLIQSIVIVDAAEKILATHLEPTSAITFVDYTFLTPANTAKIYINIRGSSSSQASAYSVTPIQTQINTISEIVESALNNPLKNIYNKNTAIAGYFIRYNTGALGVSANQTASDYIPIEPNTYYTSSNHNPNETGIAIPQFAFYDSNKTYISGLANSGVRNSLIFKTPANAAYIRVTVQVAQVDYYQLEKGAGVTYYAPYAEGIGETALPYKLRNNYVIVSENGQYQSLLKALKETPDYYTIYLGAGTYDIYQEYLNYYGTDFWTNYTGYSSDYGTDYFLRGLWLGKNRKIIGEAGSVIAWNYMPTIEEGETREQARDRDPIWKYFSVIANDTDIVLENVTITINDNCRYAIHDDFKPSNGTVTFKDLIIKGTPGSSAVIGAGLGSNNIYNIEGCVFLNNTSIYDISYHGNTSASAAKASKINIKNCYGNKKCSFRWYGIATEVTQCIVNNSKFSTIECVAYDAEQTNINMNLIEYNNY